MGAMKDTKVTPVFRETVKAFENLKVGRDGMGRWTTPAPDPGWYQSVSGGLYHYDGIVWDEVPSEQIEKLEYLG